ncbi:IclR family transcriptional regulator [Ferruginivarius sediminum]|uniref:IclR family transcriptional regulator n=1 Tax=Ferruginivarius sediminum TaxID=2661937 RepID=A0A369TCF3_9PROT|nr:IclR family transcriptional regulator [Ferruginivarius sediminum]RDD62204.1 IclR family transcriptional regulator [Ferruginivarius sediminum]
MAPRRNKVASDEKNYPATPLKGVNRALHVLEYIAIRPGRAIDIAEAMDLSWATLHRTLQQLEQGGFLKRDPETNQYRIGPRMWFIGATYVANHRVLEIARPYVEAAVKTKGITVQLVEKSGRQSVVLLSSHSDEEITKAAYGYHFPLHTGSKGLVLLAFSGEDFINEYLGSGLEALTPRTQTDPDELRKTLEEIRERQYAITIADVQLHTASMAAPVFDRNSNVVACICFVARKSAMENVERRDQLLEKLLETAQSTSIALGWRPELAAKMRAG